MKLHVFAVSPRLSLATAFVALAVGGCSKDAVKRPVTARAAPPPPAATTAPEKKDDTPHVAEAVTNLLGLDSEIMRLCNVHVDAAQPKREAPTFDTDDSALTAEDTSVLTQVAQCLTTGALAGRHLELVGRADRRGTTEYNFVLGEHRASAVGQFLEQAGVASARIRETSRGELDATGTDDATMQEDRRVDIMLDG